MNVKIYHNPRCSKSRQTLQLLQDKNLQIEVIDYLKTPPTVIELNDILQKLNKQPRDLMRHKEDDYQTMGLSNPDLSREDLINAMITTPRLIERPIVIANGKAIIGRPPEAVLTIL